MHLGARVDQAAEVVPSREASPHARALRAEADVLLLQPAELKQLSHDPHQLVVIPRLRQVVVRSLFDEMYGSFERAPGRENHDRQVGVELPDRTKERHAAFTGGVVLTEIHVLDDDPDVLAGHEIQSLLRD